MKPKRISVLILLMAGVIALSGCGGGSGPSSEPSPPSTLPHPSSEPEAPQSPPESPGAEAAAMPAVTIQVGGKSFTATFHDNESARAIVAQMPFTLQMDDYASQEKVAGLPFDLPAARAATPAAIHTGDLHLWAGDSLVLFYTTFPNAYSYVPVGTVDDVSGLGEALGSGSVEATFTSAQN